MSRRILMLITDLEIGGTPRVVKEIATRLARHSGLHIEVACLSRWGPVATEISDEGVPVTALGAGSVASVGVIPKLVRLVRDREIDTIFSFLIHANTSAAIAARFYKTVRLIQSVQTTQPYPRWHWWLQSMIAHSADRIVVPSESVAQVAQERSHISPGQIDIIPNGVDVAAFEGVGRPFFRDRHAARGPIRVGFIGRLDPIKRVPDLLEATRLLGDAIHLHLFGEGAQRPHIERLIHDQHLRHHVTLHGVIARPQKALGQIDLLVLPSQAEGFGVVLIEAMAAGIPVIGTDVPGIRDVLRHNETGLLVPVATPSAIAAAIREIMENEALRNDLIRSATKEVADRFTWDAVIPRYRKLLSNSGRDSK